MDARDILSDALGRLPRLVAQAVNGLSPDELATCPAPHTNSIGWLVWHLTRVQDGHVAELVGEEQIWMTGNWAPRFGLTADPSNTGYGHDPDEAAAVRPESSDALIAYFETVAARTASYLGGLTAKDFDQVVDASWDPPVTLGARLVSIISDDLQHAGQAGYARGILDRAAGRTG